MPPLPAVARGSPATNAPSANLNARIVVAWVSVIAEGPTAVTGRVRTPRLLKTETKSFDSTDWVSGTNGNRSRDSSTSISLTGTLPITFRLIRVDFADPL